MQPREQIIIVQSGYFINRDTCTQKNFSYYFMLSRAHSLISQLQKNAWRFDPLSTNRNRSLMLTIQFRISDTIRKICASICTHNMYKGLDICVILVHERRICSQFANLRSKPTFFLCHRNLRSLLVNNFLIFIISIIIYFHK